MVSIPQFRVAMHLACVFSREKSACSVLHAAYVYAGLDIPNEERFTMNVQAILELIQEPHTPPLIPSPPETVAVEDRPIAKILYSLFAPGVELYKLQPPTMPSDLARQWHEFVRYTACVGLPVYTFWEWLRVDEQIECLEQAGLKIRERLGKPDDVVTLLALKHRSAVENRPLGPDSFVVIDNDKFDIYFESINALVNGEIDVNGRTLDEDGDTDMILDTLDPIVDTVDQSPDPNWGYQWLLPSYISTLSSRLPTRDDTFRFLHPEDLLEGVGITRKSFGIFLEAFEAEVDTSSVPRQVVEEGGY
ncbi:hypothetical protein P171DRAFT_485834 [Karstenula rhodostoma CBS 690.94]|uniref:Uncharacterized protein n=1 Tax=Karstenula rhodostoma CBS 690.94 TaxID=1392251 RepID=A0A9P4UBQ1_9PLEO|nr:hypothetical protein P171DRAFT_485834 [Karstenula rhodostoma CBS 690.94]